jgi:hypothetical protein
MASGSSASPAELYRLQQRVIPGNPRPISCSASPEGHSRPDLRRPVTGRRWKIYRPFVEDDWRVTPSLTLNLGLAWDMTTPITEEHNRMANYIPAPGSF